MTDRYLPSDLKLSREMSRRAAGRIRPNFDETGINSYIATLTDLANNPLLDNPHSRALTLRATGMFAYLRDRFQAQTVGDAKRALEERRVDPGIVSLWIDEGMATEVVDAQVLKGYPEFTEDMRAAKARERAKLGLPE